MEKDFDGWNWRKKRLNRRVRVPHAYSREIWWCSLGVNIGAEIDGKHLDFERPAVVMRVYNLDTLLILPLTTRPKHDPYHFLLKTARLKAWAKLTQTRVISTKRLLRKIEMLDEFQFKKLRAAWLRSI